MTGLRPTLRTAAIWSAVAIAVAAPIAIAATSPLLAWRDPIYVTACFAGIVAMTLVFLQPLLAGGYLPGLPARRGRRAHLWTGGALVAAVVVHVAGLWLTSPPDAIDALLFRSPTPFSDWGVIAMWAVFGSGLLALLRRKSFIGPRRWRLVHTALAAAIVLFGTAHALLVEGAMETISKTALCALALAATVKAMADLRAWRALKTR